MKSIKELEVGDYVVNGEGSIHKVLAILDKHEPYIFLLSDWQDHNKAQAWYTEDEFKEHGVEFFDNIEKEERWKPKKGKKYYHIELHGVLSVISKSIWKDSFPDQELYESGNCFKTQEEAEAKLESVKKLLKSRET